VRFGMFHLKSHLSDQKQILTDASIDRMQQYEKPASYGIGWFLANENGMKVVSHSGGMAGVATRLLLFPEQKVAIVVLCNASSSLPGTVALRVRELMKLPAPPAANPAKPEPFHPKPNWVKTWKGKLVTYSGEQPVEMRIHENGDIHIRLGESLWTLLNRVTYDGEYLRGIMDGDVKTEDADRLQHTVNLTLKLRGDVLCGPASAVSKPAGKRLGNALTSWLELR